MVLLRDFCRRDSRSDVRTFAGAAIGLTADYWRLGAIFGVIFFVAFLAIGMPWMLAVR
jgi:hypothetical protein